MPTVVMRLVRDCFTALCLLSLVFATTLANAQRRIKPLGDGGSGGPDKWVISYEYVGVGDAYRTYADGTNEGDYPHWNIPANPLVYPLSASYKLGGVASLGVASVGATITATLTWGASDGVSPATTPPPAKVSLLETAESVFTYGAGVTDSSVITGSVDDGKGDPRILQVSGGNATYYSSGKHLVQVDGSSGVITRTVTMAAAGSVDDPTHMGNEFEAWCTFTVALDPRTVNLSRDGAHGDVLLADGTVLGDTTFSYMNIYATGQAPPRNSENDQTFTAVFAGNWSVAWPFHTPDVDWNWEFQPSADTPFLWWDNWQTASRAMPDGNMAMLTNITTAWYGTATPPKSFTITYTAKDIQDGATATANYLLTAHDFFELKTSNPDTLSKENATRRGPYAICSQTGQQVGVYIEIAWTTTLGVSFGLDVPCSGFLSESHFSIGADFSVSYTINTGVSFTVSNMAQGEYTYIESVDMYTVHSGTSRVYDAGGQCPDQNYLIKVPQGEGYQLHVPYLTGPPPAP